MCWSLVGEAWGLEDAVSSFPTGFVGEDFLSCPAMGWKLHL